MSIEFNQEGLSTKEVIDRIERGERNVPIKPLTRSYNKIFKDNICTLFNLINIIIATLIIYTGSYKNLLFLGVLISNVSIGIFQEVRAKKSIDKLSLLNQSKITVIRDNQKSKINQHDLVKDDLMVINRGSQICADGVVVKTDGIEVDESQLTGESDPILKTVDSKVMSGSYVISGMAYVKVVNVGEESYASKIAMEAKKEKDINSQLIKTLKQIIKGLAFFIVPIGIALFLSKSTSGINTNEVILGVSAAMIGMIPEGLILITSIALAVEVINLSKKKVLVKTMGSIENLARVDLLCLDKTGTITDGNIKLVDIITCEDFEIDKLKEGISTLVENLEENATSKALKVELPSPKSWKPINRVQFSSDRKWSGVTFEKEGSYIMGAPEFVFEKISPSIQSIIDESTNKGERVLVFAHSNDSIVDNELPKDRKLIGISIMEDTIRPEAANTLNYFKKQGVAIKIISGDNPKTVSQIAKRAGVDNSDKYIDMSSISGNDDLKNYTSKYEIFGRVSPEQKKELVKIFKDEGHTVGMTGDGVNDILALKESDCSIVMAEGSDAAKGVSDFVLLDSNFDSMIGVVMGGRRVVNNIQQVASQYLMKTVYSIILAIIFIFMKGSYPFHPIQLMPITSLGVGIPSFFLAFRPNYSQIKENLLLNISIPALTSGICAVFYIMIISVVGNMLNFNESVISTLCVLLTGSVCFTSLWHISKPIDKKVGFMIITLVTIFVLTIILFRNIFSFVNIINLKMMILYIPLILSVIPIYKFIRKIVTYIVMKYVKYKSKMKQNKKS